MQLVGGEVRQVGAVHGQPVEVSVLIKVGHLHGLQYHQQVRTEDG